MWKSAAAVLIVGFAIWGLATCGASSSQKMIKADEIDAERDRARILQVASAFADQRRIQTDGMVAEQIVDETLSWDTDQDDRSLRFKKVLLTPGFALADCVLVPGLHTWPKISRVESEKAHADKRFILWTDRPARYTDLAREDWMRDDANEVWAGGSVIKATYHQPEGAESGGRVFGVGEPHGLFIMTRLDTPESPSDDLPGTDRGWIYGVTTPDGKEVLQAGLIHSCMSCHADAPHGRLFGLD